MYILLSGLNRGSHNGPSNIGERDRFSGWQSGIILSDEEMKAKKANERDVPLIADVFSLLL
ncbi:hypothetical protein [Desulfosediminicola ganghwensis]|uniref:hypothetical protein n=1 Tax=Desulfosediminicola ganghwensis TaxID=2569540 RepID=UPI001594B212|nr:hypothetical protein [Desulfosediminicola ganghwensis]